MHRKILWMSIALLAIFEMKGATVIWGAFEQDWNNFYYYGGPTPEIGFSVEDYGTWGRVIRVTADGPINIANPRAYWVLAEFGDIVNDSLFSSRDMILDAYYSDRTKIEYDSTLVAKEERFYLALIVDDADYYGWLAIDVDMYGELWLAQSVLSTEPGIVVGASPEPTIEPTPEPSSGLLLLIGVAALALRRRGGIAWGLQGQHDCHSKLPQ